MKSILVVATIVALIATTAQAKGRYVGGHGSSHKGGTYTNPRTGNHYRHH